VGKCCRLKRLSNKAQSVFTPPNLSLGWILKKRVIQDINMSLRIDHKVVWGQPQGDFPDFDVSA